MVVVFLPVMGIQLREIIPEEAIRNVEPGFFRGKKVSVDAFNAIYQFLSTIRQQDGTPLMDSQGRVTSHLSGIFYRNLRLIEAGISISYVFDGKARAEKLETLKTREKAKQEAEEKYEEALKEGDFESARKFSQRTSRLDEGMIKEAKELLEALGIPVIQAPTEGEAQASFLARKGVVDFVASQDYDCLLFGAPSLVRNLSVTNKRKMPGTSRYVDVPIEIIELESVLKGLGISREQLIILGILVGTDYNPGGIRGIGPKKALKLIKTGKEFDKLFETFKGSWTFGIEPKNLASLFEKPAIDDTISNLDKKKIDSDKIVEIMCSRHDFAEERIRNSLDKVLKEINEAEKQKGLDSWF